MAGLTAFADESVRVSSDPPMYLIAATLIPETADFSGLEKLCPPSASKLHWRDLGIRGQRKSVSEISKLGTTSTVAIASPLNSKKQERARRKLLEILLITLEERGVDTVVMESRFPSADSKDLALLRSLKGKKLIRSIDLQFGNPIVDHRLWIPDQILGALGDELSDSCSSVIDSSEWKILKSSIELINYRL